MSRTSTLPRALSRPVVAAAVVALGVLVPLVPAVVGPSTAATAASAAVTMPTAASTGVKSGVRLTAVYGTLVLDKAGATYKNLDVHGRVRVDAPNITLENSIVRGDATKTFGSLVDCNNPKTSHKGFTLRDSTLVAATPSVYQVGVIGHDFTVVRTEITRTVDGVLVVGGNVSVSYSWIHDTHYVPASQSPNGRATHNDGVQVQSGSNIVVTHNAISGNDNSALMVSQDLGAVSTVKFVANWASGGSCTVNITPSPRTSIGGMTVSSNRFVHNTSVPNCAIVLNRGVSMSSPANVWRDTDTAVVLTRGA